MFCEILNVNTKMTPRIKNAPAAFEDRLLDFARQLQIPPHHHVHGGERDHRGLQERRDRADLGGDEVIHLPRQPCEKTGPHTLFASLLRAWPGSCAPIDRRQVSSATP